MKSNAAANVIDLEAFRQRKLREEHKSTDMRAAAEEHTSAFVMPVWFCWVPMWTPFVG